MFIIISMMLSILIFFIIAVICISIYALLQYIFDSIFIYKIMKKKNKKNAMISWIPYYNKVILAKIAKKKLFGWIIFVLHLICVFLLIVLNILFHDTLTSLFEIIIIIIAMLEVIIFILNMVLFHKIMKRVTNKYVDLLVLLNVFTLGIFRSIILFMVRDNDKILIDE
ncbi:MAG: hypothetical protein VZS44_08430 [Bacilli bacterium]|nr:hypothetical protein [Bacilli bacterium]